MIILIYIGLTGWGDHDTLYDHDAARKNKLMTYAAHFPIVEVDAYFYAVQPARNIEKWLSETPDSFRFIVKAYQGMTGHLRGEIPYASKEEMFSAFIDSIQLFKDSGKLAMVLFQFPPWFDCRKSHVQYLRYCRDKMKDFPAALEFRHQSWFYPQYREKTLAFMKAENWIHSICDEPQAGSGSIPTVLETTNEAATLVRFHGRNIHGWQNTNDGKWREVRYLYRYNEQELTAWAKNLHDLKNHAKSLYVIFNNNSGGDAADNAKQMIDLLGITYKGLAPRQLGLF